MGCFVHLGIYLFGSQTTQFYLCLDYFKLDPGNHIQPSYRCCCATMAVNTSLIVSLNSQWYFLGPTSPKEVQHIHSLTHPWPAHIPRKRKSERCFTKSASAWCSSCLAQYVCAVRPAGRNSLFLNYCIWKFLQGDTSQIGRSLKRRVDWIRVKSSVNCLFIACEVQGSFLYSLFHSHLWR